MSITGLDMASKLLLLAGVLLLASTGTNALTSGTAETVSAAIAATPTSGFVYNPIESNNVMSSPGGLSTPRMLAQWPALQNMGIAQTAFVMEGCALRPPHIHPRASGLLYVIQAANMSVGFITETNEPEVNYVTTGASAIFPQGYIHYQQNLDCEPAYYTISYNSEDPGTQVVAPAFSALPSSVISATLGGEPATTYSSALPKPAFIANSDPDCVARCAALGINTLAPAPSMPVLSAAGR